MALKYRLAIEQRHCVGKTKLGPDFYQYLNFDKDDIRKIQKGSNFKNDKTLISTLYYTDKNYLRQIMYLKEKSKIIRHKVRTTNFKLAFQSVTLNK